MNHKFNPELYGTRSDLIPIEYQNLEKLFQSTPYIAIIVTTISLFYGI
ncbi:MAG: hypothetical protein ACO2O4_04590 [Minisyncoccia bacterium]|jgi:hypothetical protein